MSTVAKREAGIVAPAKTPASGRETDDLLTRAGRGDQSCLPALWALFDDGDRGRRLVEALGSPAAFLRDSVIGNAAGKDLAVREAMARKLAKVRSELEGPDPTPLERLLAERAALCWFIVHRHEDAYMTAKDLSLAQAEFYQRRIDKAHARFLAAVRTLAQVRKLALPALQVNIGANQVNVAEARS